MGAVPVTLCSRRSHVFIFNVSLESHLCGAILWLRESGSQPDKWEIGELEGQFGFGCLLLSLLGWNVTEDLFDFAFLLNGTLPPFDEEEGKTSTSSVKVKLSCEYRTLVNTSVRSSRIYLNNDLKPWSGYFVTREWLVFVRYPESIRTSLTQIH